MLIRDVPGGQILLIRDVPGGQILLIRDVPDVLQVRVLTRGNCESEIRRHAESHLEGMPLIVISAAKTFQTDAVLAIILQILTLS